jgi:hypothetical protein
MFFGTKKYKRNDWRKGYPKKDILPSLVRHVGELIDAYNEGRLEIDKESGVHLIGPIMANAMVYSYHYVVSQKSKKK